MYLTSMFLLTIYYLRFTIFYYYCKLYTFFEKHKSIKENTMKSLIFDTEIYEIFHNDNLCEKENVNFLKLNLIKNNDKILYQIYPNTNNDISNKIIIFCEVSINNKTYDITSFLKIFYVKGNIVLDRKFITYILFNHFNIKVKRNEIYNISLINADMKHIVITQDIDSFKYIL